MLDVRRALPRALQALPHLRQVASGAAAAASGVVVYGSAESGSGWLQRMVPALLLTRPCSPVAAAHAACPYRCIARMDHHCIWINSCVGLLNMRWFLGFLLSTAAICFYGERCLCSEEVGLGGRDEMQLATCRGLV